MRLTVRAEQMSEIEKKTQDRFVRQLAAHLLENYPDAKVILPDEERFTVDALLPKKLRDLVRIGISCARSYGLTFENSMAAFTALMFEIAPNFHTNSMCQIILKDDGVEPNQRINVLLETLNEKTIKTMREKYDPAAWKMEEPLNVENQSAANQPAAVPNETGNTDFVATVKIN